MSAGRVDEVVVADAGDVSVAGPPRRPARGRATMEAKSAGAIRDGANGANAASDFSLEAVQWALEKKKQQVAAAKPSQSHSLASGSGHRLS